jgi:citrate lyase beta subunit
MTNAIPDRLSRSMLFVPAPRWPMIEKAALSAADAVCIDLEDSVTVDEKPAARANVIRALRELDFRGKTRMYRINAADTPFAEQDVLEVVEAVGDKIDLVMLPKAESAEHVAFVDRLLGSARIGIEAQIETAAGFVELREISRASARLESLILGAGDYSASMRMPSSSIGSMDETDALYPGHRWHAVMHAIVAHARARGLRCMDGPYAAFKDTAGFERACRIARSMGFDGKQCIHPSQLAVVNDIFAPSGDEIAHAERVMEAGARATADGKGAVTLDGKMIDAASYRMARSVLDQRDRMRALTQKPQTIP